MIYILYVYVYLQVDPSKITKFEKEFMTHVKAAHQDILDIIAKDGQLTKETDDKLKKIVQDFMASWTA